MNSRTEEMLCKHIDELGEEYARLQNDLGNRLEKPRHKKRVRINKRAEEYKKCHELMWTRQREAREKALKIKAKNEAQRIDKYRRMEFSALLKEYLALYFVVKICVKGSSDDSHMLKLIGREVSEFRSQTEQAELKNKVERLNKLSATLFKINWLSNVFKKITSWTLGRCQ